jgi:hypothetical protein
MFRDEEGLKRMRRSAGKQPQISLTEVQTQAFVVPSDDLALVFQAIAVSSLLLL